MGSVFQNTEVKKRYIPKVRKHEENVQKQVCNYLRQQYPQVIFRSDYSSGLKLTQNQAVQHKRLQSSRSWPDLFIYEPRTVKLKNGTEQFYCGLALELKKDGTTIAVKIGPRKGMLTANPHIREQALMIKQLNKLGYYASFAVGYDQAVDIIDKYFGRKKIENTTIF